MRRKTNMSAIQWCRLWGCTYHLVVDKGKGASIRFQHAVQMQWHLLAGCQAGEESIYQASACSTDAAALTCCWLRRGREHLSAFSMPYRCSSTYFLLVEEGK